MNPRPRRANEESVIDPNRIAKQNARKQRKTSVTIPARTIPAIGVAMAAKSTMVTRIGSANAKRNTVAAAAEAEEMSVIVPATTTTTLRGVIRVTANPIGKRRGGDGRNTDDKNRNVADEKRNAAAAMIIRRPPRMRIPMILPGTRNESTRETRKRRRKAAAAAAATTTNQKNAGV